LLSCNFGLGVRTHCPTLFKMNKSQKSWKIKTRYTNPNVPGPNRHLSSSTGVLERYIMLARSNLINGELLFLQ
jgi:hypothetical protein